MALQNNLKVQVDLPVWEHLRFAPAVSTSISCACTADNSNFDEEYGRYIYYLISATAFYRYDTWTDAYVQLSSPPIAPVTWASMKFSGAFGFEGRVLSATSNTMTIPGYYGNSLKGYFTRIVHGTGKGQERFISSIADAVVGASGIVTAVSTTSITDSTKAWAVNQWQGFNLRITFGSGIGQVRRILYNDATSITFVDVNRYGYDFNANPAVMSPALSATAGVQSVYAIESSVATLDSNWLVTPDVTSKFRIFSGKITLVSSAAATPFYTIQDYDIESDTWYIKTSCSALLSAAGTDGTIERTAENASIWDLGVASGGTTTTLVDSSKSWTVNQFAGYYLRIYSGTAEGQLRQILSNTANTLTWSSSGTAPDSTSRYFIDGFDSGTLSSATSTVLTDSTKSWDSNRWKNLSIRIVAGTGKGQFGAIASNTGTAITLYTPFKTTPDATSVYTIQGDKDDLYLSVGGQASIFKYSVEADMSNANREYDTGVARIGAAQFGDYPPIAITSGTGTSGTITITTAQPHGFKTGWSITHTGDTGASAVANNITATITVTGATTYTYVAPGSTAAWTLAALSTTVLRDTSKTWTVNEHANRILWYITGAPAVATGAATMVAMEIASNTANSITLKTATTIPVNGLSRYVITDRATIGSLDSGIATGTHSTTTLQDTSKSWVVNIWAGRRLKMLSGTGQSIEIAIASNTSNTLTFAVTTAPVSASTSYSICGGTVKGLGISMNWASNVTTAKDKGKYLWINRGGAVLGFDRLNLNTDRWDIVTTHPQIETLTTGTMSAYDGNDRIYFTKDNTQRCFYLNLDSQEIHGAGVFPYISGTAILGNRMEIFKTADNLKYLWLNRHSGQECYRQLLFY